MKKKYFKMENMLKAFSCLTVGTLLSYSNVSYGEDVGGSGEVDATCNIGTISGFTIPTINVDNLNTPLNVTFNIPVTCTNGSEYDLSFNNGLHHSSEQPRLHDNSSGYIAYDIKNEASGATTYTGLASNVTYSGSASSGSETNIQFTAETEAIPVDALVGNYSDTITVTLNVTN